MSAEATKSAPSTEATQALASYFIAQWESEIQTTGRVIAAVPENNLNFRPDPKSKTALAMIRHLTISDEWMLNSAADGAMRPPSDESDACGIMTAADGQAQYESRLTAALNRVRALSTEDLGRTIDFFGMMQIPAAGLVGMALKHSIHHRGQLSTYLRAAGGKVPGIYGPSADTQ